MTTDTASNEFAHYKLLFIENFSMINKKLDGFVLQLEKRDERFMEHLISDAKWKSKAKGWIAGAVASGSLAVGVFIWYLSQFVFKDK